MKRISYLERESNSLIYLLLDNERIFENLEELQTKVGGSISNLSRVMSCDSEQKQSCKKTTRLKILNVVHLRVLELRPGDKDAAQAMVGIFQERLSKPRTFDFRAAVAGANESLKELTPPNFDNRQSIKSKRRNEFATSRFAFLKLKWILVPTILLLCSVLFFFNSQSSSLQSRAFALSDTTAVVLFLPPPNTEYSRNTNIMFKRYIQQRLEIAGVKEIQVVEQEPNSLMTEDTARKLTAAHDRLTVVWLILDEVPQGKRLYINRMSNDFTAERGTFQSSISSRDIDTFDKLDIQMQAIYTDVLGIYLCELCRLENFSRVRQIIDDTYAHDSKIKAHVSFDPVEVVLLAHFGRFEEALELSDDFKIPTDLDLSEVTIQNLLTDLDYHKAVLLFRLHRYEEAYLLLARKNSRTSLTSELSFTPSGFAYSSNGVVFLNLHYPGANGILYRLSPKKLLVIELPFGKFFNEALLYADRDNYLADIGQQISKLDFSNEKEGVYFYKAEEPQVGSGEVTLDLLPKWIREVNSVRGW